MRGQRFASELWTVPLVTDERTGRPVHLLGDPMPLTQVSGGRGGRFVPLVGAATDLLKAEAKAVLPPPASAAASSSPVSIPVEVPAGGDFADLWLKQQKILANARGSDRVGPWIIPRTTNADAVQLAEWWAEVLVGTLTKESQGKHLHEVQTTLDAFVKVKHDVDTVAEAGAPSAVYANNHDLWLGTRNVAIRASTWGEQTPNWKMMIESTEQAVKDLPANVIGRPLEYLWDNFKKPILIGGAVLGGLLLLVAAEK